MLLFPIRKPTTNLLITTTLIYAAGAGITAAAGTRLALQKILEGFCASIPTQQLDSRAQRCDDLFLPPCRRTGQFARLLPSLDVVAISKAPSPESNLNSPSPVDASVCPDRTDTADGSGVWLVRCSHAFAYLLCATNVLAIAMDLSIRSICNDIALASRISLEFVMVIRIRGHPTKLPPPS